MTNVGPTIKYTSSSSRKAYVGVSILSKRAKTEQAISFFNESLMGTKLPYKDFVVITLTIANSKLQNVLVDNGCSIDILFYEAFERMKLGRDRLKKMKTPLYGFLGKSILVEGSIKLPMTVQTMPYQYTIMVNFLVINIPNAYNTILGRPELNSLKAVISTPHLNMKFPTKNRARECKGNQETSL